MHEHTCIKMDYNYSYETYYFMINYLNSTFIFVLHPHKSVPGTDILIITFMLGLLLLGHKHYHLSVLMKSYLRSQHALYM